MSLLIMCEYIYKNVYFCSVTGKKLMSKCRSLLQENQELGKQISQGRVVELEAEISLYKKHCEELKNFNEGLICVCLQKCNCGYLL